MGLNMGANIGVAVDNKVYLDYKSYIDVRREAFSDAHPEIRNPYSEVDAQVYKLLENNEELADKKFRDSGELHNSDHVIEVLEKLPVVLNEIDKQLNDKLSENYDRTAREAMAVHILALDVKNAFIHTTFNSNEGYARDILTRADEQLQSALERNRQREEQSQAR